MNPALASQNLHESPHKPLNPPTQATIKRAVEIEINLTLKKLRNT
jgi:hypothetical protein